MFRPRLAVELLGLDICDIWIFLDIEMDIEMDFFWKGDFGSESIPLKLLIFFCFVVSAEVPRGQPRCQRSIGGIRHAQLRTLVDRVELCRPTWWGRNHWDHWKKGVSLNILRYKIWIQIFELVFECV